MTKKEDEEEGGCPLCLSVRALLSSVPSMLAAFDVQNLDWAWVLMLCNFEDRVFEVMHELHSFLTSS